MTAFVAAQAQDLEQVAQNRWGKTYVPDSPPYKYF